MSFLFEVPNATMTKKVPADTENDPVNWAIYSPLRQERMFLPFNIFWEFDATV